MNNIYRNVYCGEVTKEYVGKDSLNDFVFDVIANLNILNNVTAQSLIVECEQVKGIELDNGEIIKAESFGKFENT